VVGVETENIEDIKKLGFVKEARISEKADIRLKDAGQD
jgi:hypothetical protein